MSAALAASLWLASLWVASLWLSALWVASLWVSVLWVAPALLALAALPVWPHSRAWGWVPAAGLALLAALVLTLRLLYVI